MSINSEIYMCQVKCQVHDPSSALSTWMTELLYREFVFGLSIWNGDHLSSNDQFSQDLGAHLTLQSTKMLSLCEYYLTHIYI